MTDDADRFLDCLHLAEEQLHWGTDPRALEETARGLARIEPGSVLVEQLVQRAAVLRAARRELTRRSPTPPPARSPAPAWRLANRA
jgi:hypothetical protein